MIKFSTVKFLGLFVFIVGAGIFFLSIYEYGKYSGSHDGESILDEIQAKINRGRRNIAIFGSFIGLAISLWGIYLLLQKDIPEFLYNHLYGGHSVGRIGRVDKSRDINEKNDLLSEAAVFTIEQREIGEITTELTDFDDGLNKLYLERKKLVRKKTRKENI